jgi:MFS-type transporter involved in bile tolerance (Atg22 family)
MFALAAPFVIHGPGVLETIGVFVVGLFVGLALLQLAAASRSR